MKLFSCDHCSNVLYFENRSCSKCGHVIGYSPDMTSLVALEPDEEVRTPKTSTETRMPETWTLVRQPSTRTKFCANTRYDVCNWLIPAESDVHHCVACRHNGTVPDLSSAEGLSAWRDLEFAKHRLIYSLLRWRLPLKTRSEDPQHGLIFNFLADPPHGPKVLTGHDNGVITIALSEADDLERERRRLAMGEPYRTLLGHFRHEVGHHFWDLLVRDTGKLAACRELFGDDTLDYETSLKRYYREGPPETWQDNYVSAYATMHPWEDFAETWAHYLHIVDTLEMAVEFGLNVQPRLDRIGGLSASLTFDPYIQNNFNLIAASWLPFIFAMNNVSRAMGSRDIYPFILSTQVLRKLEFVHEVIHGHTKSPKTSW
ncbi:MAG TPA: putative zinc-binding peptidase [Afipia sp.]